MRPKFRETLGRYKDNIVDQTRVGSDEVQLARLVTAAEVEIARRAEALGATRESQEHIFELQRRKQEIMTELKRTLRVIDGVEPFEFRRRKRDRLVRYDVATQTYIVGEGDAQEVATLGETLFDNDFGAGYAMDFSDATIPRSTRKRFAVEQTKRRLRGLLNRQIITEETNRPEVSKRVREIYSALERKLESTQQGFLAERVVEYLLKRLELDEALPFQFEIADVHQDVEQKIDFIIKVRTKSRGVNVEASQGETIGIQFTLNPTRTSFKEAQIAKAKETGLEGVDDLVLVTIPLEHIDTIFYQWEERRRATGKTAGGPVSFLLPEEKEVLVRGIFGKLFAPGEMNQYVERAAAVFAFDQGRVAKEERRMSLSWEKARKKSPGQLRDEADKREIQKRKRAKPEAGRKKASRRKLEEPETRVPEGTVEEGAWSHIQTIMNELQRRSEKLIADWKKEKRRWVSEEVSEEEQQQKKWEFHDRHDLLNADKGRLGNILLMRVEKRKQKHADFILRLSSELRLSR